MPIGFDSPDLIPTIKPLPAEPGALAELDRQIAATKAMATDHEIQWLILEVETPPGLRDDPATWNAMSYQAGVCVWARESGIEFPMIWKVVRNINRIDEERDPHKVEFWERLRRAMERLAAPSWRP